MDKSKWTDRLPGLLEGHTEAEPEGLWDAVQAGMKPKAHRVAAGWWYAAGSLAAAAAVALVVFLWPQPGSPVVVSPVPGDNTQAQVEENPAGPAVPAGADTLGVDTAGVQNEPLVPTGAFAGPAGAQIRPVLLTDASDAPVQEQDVTESPLKDDDAPVQGQIDPESSRKEDETPVQEQNASETPRNTLPAEWLRPDGVPSTRKTGRKVQLSVTSGGMLAQAGTSTRSGYGLPDVRSVPGGPAGAPMALFSSVHRNKASSTESKHWQNFRAGLMANYAFSSRWSMETGLQYTSLQARETAESGNGSVVTDRHFNYLGIPLNIQFKPLELGQFSVYLSAGPMYEFLLGGRERSQTFAGGVLAFEDEPQKLDLKDHRWSLNAGVGLQWQPFRYGAFFVQPGVSWHIPGPEDAPETFYSVRPVAFDLVFGVKIILR